MRKKIIAEIKTELTMRRKVWPRIYQQSEEFIKPEHQSRYNILKECLAFFDAMTDADFAKIASKMDLKSNNEPTLF